MLYLNRLKEIGVTAEIGQVQKTVLLGTARTLRKVLEIYDGWLCLHFEIIFQSRLCVSAIIIIVILMITTTLI